MFNSLVELPVPLTVRPLRLLGGGSSNSKSCPRKHQPPRHAECRRSLESINKSTAGQTNTPDTVINTVIQVSNDNVARMTHTVPVIPPAPPPPRPTFTILTELDEDGAGAGDLGFTNAGCPTIDGGTAEGASRRVYQDPLASTQTLLSPLSYSFLCQQTNAEDVAKKAATHSSQGAHQPSMEGCTDILVPTGSGARPEDMYKCSFNAVSHTDFADVAEPADTSFPSGVPNPVLSIHPWTTTSAGSADSVQHPLRISATPVVPIVPHVTEPSSRKRVAEDMQQLYGGVGTAAGLTSVDSTDGSTPASAAVATERDAPSSTPKKKSSKIPFFSSSGANKATKAEELKRASPPTAAERRLAREQVIRVGVQRLYRRLNELHLDVYRVRNDGNCQFRAISHQLLGSEDYHDIVRSQIVSYMRSARAETFDHYFESPAHADAYYDNLAKLGSWGDELSLRAASDCLYVNIHVLSSEERNCYITYRPSTEHSAPAPSFLVDVFKLRERRRAERRLLRAHEFRHPTRSQHSQSSHNAFQGLGQASSLAGPQDSAKGIGAAATMPSDYGCHRGNCGARTVREKCGNAAVAGQTLSVPQGGARGCPPESGQPRLLRPMCAGDITTRPSEGGHNSDDESELDANAIQLALHRRLQHAEIFCSRPLSRRESSSFGALASWSGVGGGDNNHRPATMPLLQPRSNMSVPNRSLHLPAAPAPRLVRGNEDASRGGAANQVEKFCAFGAEVQSLDAATQSVNIFTQKVEPASTSITKDGVDCHTHISTGDATATLLTSAVTPAVPRPLLQPQVQEGAVVIASDAMEATPPVGYMQRVDSFASAPALSSAHLQGDETGEVMLLAPSMHRGRPKGLLSQSFSYMQSANSFTGFADSFSADVSQSSSTALFAFGSGQREASAQSHGSFVPRAATSSFASGADYGSNLLDGSDAGGEWNQRCSSSSCYYYYFEPRTEPIDIFLSYLYPVHYNSLSVK